jgi:hypothetical protein
MGPRSPDLIPRNPVPYADLLKFEQKGILFTHNKKQQENLITIKEFNKNEKGTT